MDGRVFDVCDCLPGVERGARAADGGRRGGEFSGMFSSIMAMSSRYAMAGAGLSPSPCGSRRSSQVHSVHRRMALPAHLRCLRASRYYSDGRSASITAGAVQAAPRGYRGTTLAVHSTFGFGAGFLGPLVVGIVSTRRRRIGRLVGDRDPQHGYSCRVGSDRARLGARPLQALSGLLGSGVAALRVALIVDLEQALGVDRRVALGGRQRGVAQ